MIKPYYSLMDPTVSCSKHRQYAEVVDVVRALDYMYENTLYTQIYNNHLSHATKFACNHMAISLDIRDAPPFTVSLLAFLLTRKICGLITMAKMAAQQTTCQDVFIKVHNLLISSLICTWFSLDFDS